MDQTDPDQPRLAPAPEEGERDHSMLLRLAALGDADAFELLYRELAPPAYGVIRRVLRDPAQSEEVTQEVMLEVWRTAARFDPARSSASTWVLTIAHRRAVDRVRTEVAASEREQKAAWADVVPDDDVADVIENSMDRDRVRRCLGDLSEVQRQSITLAYYHGYTYRQVSALVDATLAAIKSRIRDGLLRMRDCLGVS